MDENNFKVYFSNILSDKYHLTQEQIDGYWSNKEKEEKENKKSLIDFGTSVTGVVTSAVALRVGDELDNIFGSVLVAIGFIGLCASCRFVISSMRRNPYKLKDNNEIDTEYLITKRQYMKTRK